MHLAGMALHTELTQQLVARGLDVLPAALANPAFDPVLQQQYAKNLMVRKSGAGLAHASSPLWFF